MLSASAELTSEIWSFCCLRCTRSVSPDGSSGIRITTSLGSVFPAYRRMTSAITSCQRLESVTCMATPRQFPKSSHIPPVQRPVIIDVFEIVWDFLKSVPTVTFRSTFVSEASCSRWDGSGLDLDGEELLDRDIQHPGESNRSLQRRAVQALRSSRSGQPGTKKFTPFRSRFRHSSGGASRRSRSWCAARTVARSRNPADHLLDIV